MAELDKERAKFNPSAEFDTPADVVKSTRLTRAEKEEMLKQWELDARLMQVATEENMGGGEPSMLDQVKKAQKALGVEPAADQPPPTKAGG
jgi:hypothetical protein